MADSLRNKIAVLSCFTTVRLLCNKTPVHLCFLLRRIQRLMRCTSHCRRSYKSLRYRHHPRHSRRPRRSSPRHLLLPPSPLSSMPAPSASARARAAACPSAAYLHRHARPQRPQRPHHLPRRHGGQAPHDHQAARHRGAPRRPRGQCLRVGGARPER